MGTIRSGLATALFVAILYLGPVSAAFSHGSGTGSVPGDKDIHYEFKDTRYQAEVKNATGQWNRLGVVKFRPDSALFWQNLRYRDTFDNTGDEASQCGWWSPTAGSDDIYFNTAVLEDTAIRINHPDLSISCALHESGHALGFDHFNGSTLSVMNNDYDERRIMPHDCSDYRSKWGSASTDVCPK